MPIVLKILLRPERTSEDFAILGRFGSIVPIFVATTTAAVVLLFGTVVVLVWSLCASSLVLSQLLQV